MKQHKHQFSKLGLEFKEGDIDGIVLGSKRYRDLLVHVISNKIEGLAKTMESDFDKRNYGLHRAYRDGGMHHLNLLKELIKDD